MAVAARRIQPNAENCTEAELNVAAKCTSKHQSAVRMLAIRALIIGTDPAAVLAIFDITQRTLFNWVRRFNQRGIDGLIEGKRAGRPRKITSELSDRCRYLIQEPQTVGVFHWTAKKFHGYLREELGQELGYRTVVRWLHDAGFRLKVPQPWPDRQDEAQRAEYVCRLQKWLSDDNIDLWFSDEMGVDGDPRPRRRWAQKGSNPRVTKNGDHLRMNVMGMVCPRQGEFYGYEFTHSDTECFQIFLDEANREIEFKRPRNLLIMDNACWHKSKSLKWGRFEPVYLPAYSPDLNPIERLWLIIKAEWFTDFVAKNMEQLIERLDQALNWAMNRQTENQRTCTIKKEL